MAYRKVKRSDLAGKTVKSVSQRAVNHLKITFSDGTKLQLWADGAVHTQFGSIPGILVDDPSIKSK